MRLVNFALLLSVFPVVDAAAATIQASSCSRDAVLIRSKFCQGR